MKNVIVIHEIDEDGGHTIVGVASNRAKALELVAEYYGEHKLSNFRDIRQNEIDFSCTVKVEGKFGGSYEIFGDYFVIDSL